MKSPRLALLQSVTLSCNDDKFLCTAVYAGKHEGLDLTSNFLQDLKPENLLLAEKPSEDRPPIIKLTDFGIAQSIEGNT